MPTIIEFEWSELLEMCRRDGKVPNVYLFLFEYYLKMKEERGECDIIIYENGKVKHRYSNATAFDDKRQPLEYPTQAPKP